MDIETYRVQLRQVDAALTQNPGDDELTKLKADLEEIIKVSAELEDDAASEPVVTTGSGFNAGDAVTAKYSVDGLLYPAVVVKAEPEGHTVTVKFVGWNNVEEVALAHVFVQQQETTTSAPQGGVAAPTIAPDPVQGGDAPMPSKSAEEALRLVAREVGQKEAAKNKRLKQAKHREEKATKAAKRAEERKVEVDAWKKFNNSSKRGHTLFKSLKKKKASMFASPTTVNGRVGVIGSDQKMTVNQDMRRKHVFKESGATE